jgi:hypothetical protein
MKNKSKISKNVINRVTTVIVGLAFLTVVAFAVKAGECSIEQVAVSCGTSVCGVSASNNGTDNPGSVHPCSLKWQIGDANCSGEKADEKDYFILKNYFLKKDYEGCENCTGDLNEDGTINLSDFETWRKNALN